MVGGDTVPYYYWFFSNGEYIFDQAYNKEFYAYEDLNQPIQKYGTWKIVDNKLILDQISELYITEGI